MRGCRAFAETSLASEEGGGGADGDRHDPGSEQVGQKRLVAGHAATTLVGEIDV
jgi:hypothetical protein